MVTTTLYKPRRYNVLEALFHGEMTLLKEDESMIVAVIRGSLVSAMTVILMLCFYGSLPVALSACLYILLFVVVISLRKIVELTVEFKNKLTNK